MTTDIRDDDQRWYAQLAKQYPQLMAGTRLLAGGGTALIVEGPQEGVLTKIFTNTDDEKKLDDKKRLARNEVRILRLLEDRQPHDLNVPKIIDDKITEKGKRLSLAFRMTKLPGTKVDWDEFLFEEPEGIVSHHLHYAGAALGRLQLAMADITRKQLPDIARNDEDRPRRDRVTTISWLGDDWNRALEKLNTYLTKYAPKGVIHHDYNCNNFLLNKDLKVSGVFDFAQAYHSPNKYAEVVDAKLFLSEGHWRDFAKGYASQMPLYPEVLMGAEIAHECHVVDIATDDWQNDSAKIFHSRMAALSHITGFTPPSLKSLQGGPK